MLYGAWSSTTDESYINSERHPLQRAKSESFPEELNALKGGKVMPRDSKLLPLSPEYDLELGLMRVGSRL